MATNKDIEVIDLVSSEDEVEVIEWRHEELVVLEEPQDIPQHQLEVRGRGHRGRRGRGGSRGRRTRRRRQVTPASTSADSSIVSLPSPGREGLREVVRTSERVLPTSSSSSSSSSSSETTDEDFTQPPKKEAKRVITPGSGQKD